MGGLRLRQGGEAGAQDVQGARPLAPHGGLGAGPPPELPAVGRPLQLRPGARAAVGGGVVAAGGVAGAPPRHAAGPERAGAWHAPSAGPGRDQE
eukprot:4405420-Lingulodinium_polyedra.AAC.1